MIRPSSHMALKHNVAWFAWLLQWWWSRNRLLALSAGCVQGHGLLTWETWKVHICVPCVSYNMCHDYVLGIIFFKPTVFQGEWAISTNIRAYLPCCQWVHTPQCLLVLLSPLPHLNSAIPLAMQLGRVTQSSSDGPTINLRKSNWTFLLFTIWKALALRIE